LELSVVLPSDDVASLLVVGSESFFNTDNLLVIDLDLMTEVVAVEVVVVVVVVVIVVVVLVVLQIFVNSW
jgi:hypothetical protein